LILPLRIGIVGGGMISQVAHLPFYLGDSRCEVAAVAESRPSLARHLREELRVPVVQEPEDLYDQPDISAVVIVAPRPASGPLALAALRAGKHVLVEKPMAHTTCQAARLVAEAQTTDRILGVAYMKRYDPGVQAAKRAFEDLNATGRLGPLLLARFYDFARDYAHMPPPHKRPEESRTRRFETWPTAPQWLLESRAADYAWFMNAASHDVNLLRFFFPSGLHVIHAVSPKEGVMSVTMRLGDVSIVFDLAKSASGAWVQGAEFVFESGRLLVELPSPMASGKAARVTLWENQRSPCARELEVEPEWCFQRQAEDFVSALLEGRPTLTSGAEALDELRLIKSIWQSACGVPA
jgi:predicted dehydrogenase